MDVSPQNNPELLARLAMLLSYISGGLQPLSEQEIDQETLKLEQLLSSASSDDLFALGHAQELVYFDMNSSHQIDTVNMEVPADETGEGYPFFRFKDIESIMPDYELDGQELRYFDRPDCQRFDFTPLFFHQVSTPDTDSDDRNSALLSTFLIVKDNLSGLVIAGRAEGVKNLGLAPHLPDFIFVHTHGPDDHDLFMDTVSRAYRRRLHKGSLSGLELFFKDFSRFSQLSPALLFERNPIPALFSTIMSTGYQASMNRTDKLAQYHLLERAEGVLNLLNPSEATLIIRYNLNPTDWIELATKQASASALVENITSLKVHEGAHVTDMSEICKDQWSFNNVFKGFKEARDHTVPSVINKSILDIAVTGLSQVISEVYLTLQSQYYEGGETQLKYAKSLDKAPSLPVLIMEESL